MSPTRLMAAAMLLCCSQTMAQGTRQPNPVGKNHVSSGVVGGTSQVGVATQPSGNPFKDPIGQGVPPAASSNRNLNGNRTSVPITR